ncbi:MAG: Bug family tripartite tricarboxylate transporter substrate binding protein [Burkholderiales bacterium]
MRSLILTNVTLAALAWILMPSAIAQAYPVKPIRVVIPNPAGGIDAYLRLAAPKLQELLGQPLVIENRPGGASGSIGTDNIAKSAPDGYSLLFCTPAQIVTGPFLNKNLPYHPIRDFTPISKLLEPVETLAVRGELPANTMRELIDYAKKNPGKLTYGSSGVGSIPHFDGELFKAGAGVDLLHIPYKGIAQIIPELAAGRIDVAFPAFGSAAPMLSAGKIRVLAVLGSTRYARMPDVPAITETLPGFQAAPIWFSLFGPAGLPRPMVDRLYGAVSKALAVPEVREQFEKLYMRAVATTPEALAAAIKADTELVAGLVKQIGLNPE